MTEDYEVMQYTGRKDDKGTEVREHDVVKVPVYNSDNEHIGYWLGYIRWCKTLLAWVVQFEAQHETLCDVPELEVVGPSTTTPNYSRR